MGKCIASGHVGKEITICKGCFHHDVCGDRDYLSENKCCNFVAEPSIIWNPIETAPEEELVLIRDEDGDIRYARLVNTRDGKTGRFSLHWWDVQGYYVGGQYDFCQWARLPL